MKRMAVALALSMAFIPLGLGASGADASITNDKACPSNPAGSHRFFITSNVDEDRVRLEALGADHAQSGQPICILAFFDASESAYSRKLAIRRASWVRDILVAQGVTMTRISFELRPSAPDSNKNAAREVNVIIGLL